MSSKSMHHIVICMDIDKYSSDSNREKRKE